MDVCVSSHANLTCCSRALSSIRFPEPKWLQVCDVSRSAGMRAVPVPCSAGDLLLCAVLLCNTGWGVHSSIPGWAYVCSKWWIVVCVLS